MKTSSDEFIDNIFLSYDKILAKLKLQNVKTKSGKEVTHKDLRKVCLHILQE